MPVASMLGAAAAGALVYGLGSAGRGGPTPLRLTLAGVIVTAFLAALTTLILISDRETLDQIRFWTAGSLAGRDMPLLTQMTPIILLRRRRVLCLLGQTDYHHQPGRRCGERARPEYGRNKVPLFLNRGRAGWRRRRFGGSDRISSVWSRRISRAS